MRRLKFIAVGILLAATVGCMKKQNESGYIGPQKVEVGERMTPEILLALGRLSDPQLSPDGGKILFGVSYQSIEKTRAAGISSSAIPMGAAECSSTYAKSVNCARWSNDGKTIYFVQDGQIWKAPQKAASLERRCR